MSQTWKFMAISEPRRRALSLVQRVAGADCTVLILGPTGIGKDILAADIYRHSRRANGPFVALNCASISPMLFESELFGHARGAYTSATTPKIGLVELADGGTLFLDEVGELPLEAQAKILRFLDSGVFWPVGSTREKRVDVRVIAATNRDLPALITAGGTFRADLYYRLSVVTIALPALERADVEGLARMLLAEIAEGSATGELDRSEVEALVRLAAERTWPGGVRELRNAIQRVVLLRTPEESAETTWNALLAPYPAAPAAPEPWTAPAAGDHGAILGALEDLFFLAAAREERAVRGLARKVDLSLQATYDRLRRLKIAPGDLRSADHIDRALARARRRLAPHAEWIHALLKG
jgi:transcriptional regulator with PAS, ATPase and Fis domain